MRWLTVRRVLWITYTGPRTVSFRFHCLGLGMPLEKDMGVERGYWKGRQHLHVRTEHSAYRIEKRGRMCNN